MNTKNSSMAIIGVGNMAKAIITGILSSNINISKFYLYDKNIDQYSTFANDTEKFIFSNDIYSAVSSASCVLISVKPQNYEEVLAEIATAPDYEKKLYISIGAGITADSVSQRLGGACTVRVLPNVPMIIGKGVSVICESPKTCIEDFEFVCSVFKSSGSVLIIDESEMNRIIGVTSSSPAYVFKFINAIYNGAISQGVTDRDLLNSICDMVIGSAMLMKQSCDSPEKLISKVASKGGTTERALATLDEYQFEKAILEAMLSCTARANELGSEK